MIALNDEHYSTLPALYYPGVNCAMNDFMVMININKLPRNMLAVILQSMPAASTVYTVIRRSCFAGNPQLLKETEQASSRQASREYAI